MVGNILEDGHFLWEIHTIMIFIVIIIIIIVFFLIGWRWGGVREDRDVAIEDIEHGGM